MKTNYFLSRPGIILFVVVFVGLAFGREGRSQSSTPRALVVNGKPMAGGLVELQGRTYVDLQMISQALGGTLTFEPDHITLATPATPVGNGARGAQQPSAGGPPAGAGLSTNFRSAAITALGGMRQWQGAVESVIRYAVPVVGTWPQDYRDQVESALNQAKVFAYTDDDQSALLLLQNNFTNLKAWSDAVVAERTNLNASRFVDPDALKKDTALAKIADCGRFLAGMITSGAYSENATCH
jgi:hypothetical protein